MKKQAKLSEHLALAGGVETSNHVTVDGRSACKQIIILSIDEKKEETAGLTSNGLSFLSIVRLIT